MQERMRLVAGPTSQHRHLRRVIIDQVVWEGSEVPDVVFLIAIGYGDILWGRIDSHDRGIPSILAESKIRLVEEFCNMLKLFTKLVILACVSVSKLVLKLA